MSSDGSDRGDAAQAPPALDSIGFGPDSVLMNDPKLFVDSRFFASLLVELESEFGPDGAHATLFQIGLCHGLRDARRVMDATFDESADYSVAQGCSTSLSMCLGAARSGPSAAGLAIDGHWPERHEAEARLSRLGACNDPACFLSAGYTSGWLSGTHDMDVLAVEVECVAAGALECRFDARDVEQWQADDALPGRLAFLPMSFDTARARLSAAESSNEPGRRHDTRPGGFDSGDDAVHVWGPVMVLPLTSIDDALCTIDMLGNDPAAGQIRVVVLDLRNQLLDDGLMAAGLERILDCIQAWGAEAILTGVSPFAEAAVSELEAAYALTRKDLSEAIAAAFQIAEAQRHLL